MAEEKPKAETKKEEEPSWFDKYADRWVDHYINNALAFSNVVLGGDWPQGLPQEFPRLPLDVFEEIAQRRPDESQIYLAAIRSLPDSMLSRFFQKDPETKWTQEMVEKELKPFVDVERVGLAKKPEPTGDYSSLKKLFE